jgi:glycosyltransferase involved in cell wall biosynthesis
MLSGELLTPFELPAEPIRVALVITGLEVGGAEKCLTQLALNLSPIPPSRLRSLNLSAPAVEWLSRVRFMPEVYSLQRRPEGDKAVLADKLEAAGVPLYFLNAASSLSFPKVVETLRRHFRRQRPHAVQTFLYHANVAGVIAARLAGISNVSTGLRVSDPRWFRSWVERLVYPFAIDNICVSQSVQSFYQDRCPSSLRPRLSCIPNAIDLSAYRRATMPGDAPKNQRVLLYVGRLHEQKGLDWLLDCLPEVFRQLPDHKMRFVGEGPERGKLLQKARELQREHRIEMLGWRGDVPELLSQAEMLILPSRYEGMPNVLLEAMAAGVPVVATRVDGVEEVLGERAAELTVPFGDHQALIDRIVSLAADAPRREALARWGRERVETSFSVPKMVFEYQYRWAYPLWEQAMAREAAATYPACPSPPSDKVAPAEDSP